MFKNLQHEKDHHNHKYGEALTKNSRQRGNHLLLNTNLLTHNQDLPHIEVKNKLPKPKQYEDGIGVRTLRGSFLYAMLLALENLLDVILALSKFLANYST